ncbi:nesprin-2 isoform X1 [Oncorhynchus mykiss]|uniref:nesprin-2 isoform X1 n=1 Tax=Oncorhynchus mykiss TaxID=8022 RepID=UPI0018777362|nr:nesprin-2 isoform X1 [Oncorhynchus mykiss]
MASGLNPEEAPLDDGVIPLDIDNVHMLLQVEQEQIQKRTFTNWINAQLSKRSPPTTVLDLFSDLRDGARLLDLLEVMSGQRMKRERGHGFFQHRGNIQTALDFLKKKSVKLVNINIPDIIDGRPSIILGLIWTIILHCHIEELASTLSFSSRHSSLDSLASLDSRSSSPALGSPTPGSPAPRGRASPLHTRFRVSAKKALLMWVRDQCQRADCSLSVKDFKCSWRSGMAFLGILCSLRPDLVDLTQAQSRSNQQNLEEAFRLAEQELHIPRLLEPQDVDVKNPDEKSIMTYVAQFLQYSNDLPTPPDDDDLQLFTQAQPPCLSPINLPSHFTPAIAVSPLHQASPNRRAREVTCWLQRAYQELLEVWASTEKKAYAERYQAFQAFAVSFSEQRRPVMPLLGAMRRCPEPSEEQRALRAAWDCLEEKLRQCKVELDTYLPAPMDFVGAWLHRMEAVLSEEGGNAQDHACAAKEARVKQEKLKNSMVELSSHLNILHTFCNQAETGAVLVPVEKLDEIKRRFTNARVTAKYHGIKLEFREHRHTVLDLLARIGAKLRSWKGPYSSQDAVRLLLQDWHDTVDRQCLVSHLVDALQKLKQTASTYTSKAALGEDAQLVSRQVKEAESDTTTSTEEVALVKGTMGRVLSTWEAYSKNLPPLQTWLAQESSGTEGTSQQVSQWSTLQAYLNEVGNFLIEVTDPSTSKALVAELSKLNMQWAAYMKRTMFGVSNQPSAGPLSIQAVQALAQEAGWVLRERLEVESVPLKAYKKRVQLLSKKIMEVDLDSLSPFPDFPVDKVEKLRHTLPEVWQALARAERTCSDLQRATSMLEGRLAELSHWGTEALEVHQHLEERKPEREAKALISRGLQLEGQVVTEGQDLQVLVKKAQTNSPIQHLNAAALEDRVTEAVAQAQEMVEMLSSLGSRRARVPAGDEPPPKVVVRWYSLPETQRGSFAAATAKSKSDAKLATQTPPHRRHTEPHSPLQGERLPQDISQQTAIIKALPQSQSHTQAPTQPQPVGLTQSQVLTQNKPQTQQTQTPIEPRVQLLAQVETYAKPSETQPLKQSHEEQEQQPVGQSLYHVPTVSQTQKQTHIPKFKVKGQLRTQNPPHQCSDQASPHPPFMVHSEIYSKAKAMARSRLEKAKFRLQENIQEAIVLFSDRDMSDWQAKRKERALGALRPAILEEFLGAAEGLGALCSGAQLQAVKLLSLSVRSQWEACLPSEGSATLRGAECLEALRELCETLAPESSPITAAVQRRESGGGQGSMLPQLQHGATVPLQDSRGCEPGDHTLLSETGQQAGPQKQSQELPQKQAGQCSQALQDQNQTQLRQDRPLQVQGLPLQTPEHPLPVQDRPLHVQGRLLQVQGGRLMHVQKSHHQGPNHTQVIVRGDSVETEQRAPERTVIPAADTTPPQEEGLSTQEVVERYRASRSAFHSQLQRNRQSLEREFQPEPVTTSALHSHIKELQALKQETEVLWFEFELQSSQVSQQQSAEGGGLEGDSEGANLLQQWRGQQICLQTRMASLETTVELMESADSQISLISDQLDRITRQPIAISAYGMTDPWTVADFKEMDQRLHAELKCVSGQTSGGEALDPSMPPPQWHRLHQLRQTLNRVRSAAGALDCFLAQIREADAGIQAALVPLDHWQHGDGATRARGRHSGLLSIRQSVRKYGEEAGSVDGLLEAAGMELTMEGAAVTCRDTVAALSRRLDEADLELTRSGIGRGQKQKEEELSLKGRGKGAGPDMQRRGLEQKEEDAFQRKRGQEQGVGPKAQRRREEEESSGLRRKGQVEGKEGEEKRSSGQRRMALLVVLREIQRAVEQQGLKEPTLPAVQHRMRALADLEGRLAALRSELQSLEAADRGAAQTTSNPERGGATQELETLWEETHRAITERLDRCGGVTELLKRFQMVHSRLSSTLQRAERTISEQASYMGKDNLQRLLTKVHSTKAELSGLGEGVEEMRGICKQLQSQLRQILDCPETPFEGEADTLMDRWLDVTERTDSHLDNLRMGLDLWDGLLHLGGEVESWTSHKMAHLVQSHPFHSEQEVTAMQEEIRVQEESVGRFHRRASEIQVLLQSKEPPLELQVIETQMRKKMEQVKELFSDLEDVYRHLVVAKGQVAAKMAECHSSLQGIQDSLDTLSAADGPKLLTQIQELSAQLQTQEKQAEGLLEELHLMTSVASPQSLQSLAADGVRLHELVCAARQHISEMRVQAQRDIKALHSLQEEFARLQEWLQAAVLKVDKGEELSRLQEEAVEHSKHTEALSGHITTLHGSTLKHSPLLKESEKLLERCCSLHTHLLSSKENQSSLTSHTQAFQTLAQDTQAWVRVLQQQADSLATGAPCIHSQAEQRLQAAETVLSAKAEGESRMEKLKEAGHRLAHRPGLGESLKLDIMQTVSYTEVHWGAVLQSADQHRSLLHGEPELSSSLLVQRQQAWSRVNQLQHQTTQLSLFFPWPGLAQHRQAAQQARALLDQATALGPAFSALGAQRKELAQRTKEPNWEDPSWATLEDCQPALVKKLHGMCVSLEGGVRNEDRCGQLVQECRHTLNSLQERMLGIESQPRDSSFLETDTGAVEALQEAVGHMEKDFVELETLKDILLASCTTKGQATLSQEVKDLQDQKEELERGVSWLAQLQAEQQVARRDQRIREEVDNLQRVLQGLADRLGDDPETTEGFTDIRQLQQRWHVLQDCDQSLRKLAARLHHLEKAVGSEDTYGEFQLAVDSAAKDLDSLCFSLHERMQLFSGGTALRMSGAICELQQWNQAAQSNPQKSVQATLNNGKQLQGTLREALSQLDFLLDCVGRERMEQFERRAGQALSNSAALLTALAQSQVSLVSTEVDGDNKIPSNTPGKAPSCSEASLLSQPVEEVTPGGIKPLQANIDSTKDPEKGQAESRVQSKRAVTRGTMDAVKEPTKKVMSDTEQRAEDKEHGRDSLKDWSIQPAERMVTGMEDGESQIQIPMGETLTQTPITSVSATVVVPETPGTSQCGATVTEITPHHIEPMDQEGTSSPTLHKVFTIVLDTDLERQQLDDMAMANALQSRPGYDGNNGIVHTDSPQHGDSEIPATESHDYANTAVVCSGSVGGGQQSSVPDKGAQLTYTFAVVKQSDQAKQDLTEPPQKVATIFLNTAVAPAGKVLVQEAETLHREVTSLTKAELGIKSSVGLGTDPQSDPVTHLMLHPERKQLETHARPTGKSQSDNKTQRTESRDCTETKKVFTIVLDMEQPSSQSKDIKTREPPCGNGSDTFSSGDVPSKLTDSSVTGKTKNTDGGRRVKSKHRGRRRADFRSSVSKGPKVKSSKSPSASKNTESEWEQSQGPKTKGLKSKGPESGLTESKSAELAHTESESQRHTDNSEKTEPGSVDDVDTDAKDARQTEMTASQIAVNTGASDITCTADSKDNRQTVSKDTGNIDTDMLQVNDLTQTDVSQTDATRDNTQLSYGPSPAYVATETEPREGTERTAPQEQMQEGSEVKRRTSVQTGGLLSDAVAKEERVGGAVRPEVPCHRSTMQGILSKVQGLVERKDIITGGQWMDAAWYLQPSPRKPEIQIGRTVLRVLGCRYQPAQLNLANMARQLTEAEDCRRYVLEQVAAINHVVGDPEDATNLEGRWSAALLDASATVQVKEAQLHLVTQYHRQAQAIRSILERWTSDMDELQLDTRSSALQAEKLHTLLCNIEQQKGMMGELLQVCCQVSAHLSEVEGSGALLAQLGDLQEEWRLLEGTGNRGLRHASIGSSQSSILLQKAEQLHCKLETLQKSITLLQSSQLQHDTHKALELTYITADLKAFNQQYLHLLGQSEDFTQFSLGQKEKEDVECTLQSLSSLLASTQRLLSAQSYSIAKPSLAKIIKQMQDLIIWAKQAENHISAGEKVALFPEEARLQIASMRKLQSEILARRSRVHYKVEDLKELISDEGEIDKVLSSMKTLKDLYETVSDNSARILKEMEAVLEEREKMLVQISKVNTWLAVAHHEREVTADVENVSKDTIPDLESKLQFHMGAIKEAERQLAVTDALLETCMEVSSGLSPAESHFLVNRLTGLRTEVDRMVAHEKAAQWELEELLHTRTSSAEELAAVQASVQQIWADLERQRFPVTKDSLSAIEPLTHMLLEHQCQIQELQYCQEDQKSALLRTIGELQEKVKTLHHHALEHEKYLTYRQRMEDSREVAKERAQCSKDKRVSVGERFSLCQALLVELPLVKTQCQDASDQLEAIAQDLHLSDRMLLLSERQRIRQTVENLDSWELAITDDVKNLEGKLLEGLRFCTELPAMMDLLQQVRQELTEFDPVKPDVRTINIALRRCWVIWRNVESVMRVLEALRQREQVEMSQCGELHTLRNDIVQKCHAYMENLSHAREALKDYHWAAQGVVTFLLEAEAMFLAPPGGFVDCTEEQWHTQEPQASLGESLQAQISHVLELAPQQACLSFPQSEQLHIRVLSHLLVERAALEAQVELRTEALQRCADRQSLHKKCHEEVWHILKKNESRLSECATQEVTSYANCADQQDRAKTLSEEVLSIAGKLDELRVVCPLRGCCVGSEGAQGALWRRWAALRCGISLLRTRLEQRGAEWRDVTKSMARCSSALDKLQGELSDPTAVCSGRGAPMVLLVQTEQHQAGLEREQRILASLELRLSQLLGVSSPQEAASPVPVCQRLRDMQERFRSLRERSMLVRSAALSEEQERERLQEQIGEVEQRVATLLSILVSHPSTRQLKEVRVELGSLRARLQSIMECVGTKYAAVTPPEVERQLQEVTGSLQDMEEKVGQALEKSSPLNRLSSRMGEIRVGLEEVQTLLQRKSSSVSEAEHVLKFVWDQLDQWHGRLALLEGEVQEAAEEEPEQAQLLMDQITQPLQLYQDTAQKAEQRTAFLSKIPACLQEYNDIIHRAGCWLEESQSCLDAPGTYTTARSLQSQTNTLQMVLDDSERIRATLVGFGPVLVEISAVCHTTAMEDKLVQTERQVTAMQHNIMGPLDQLLHVTPEVDAIEAEVKTMEKNVTKIRAILSSTDTLDISLEEHLNNRQVILANIQSMQRTVGEIEGCKAELGLPQGAEETLSAFPRAVLLLQPLQELEQLTQEQSRALEGNMREVREAEGVIPSCNVCVTTEPSALILISTHQRNTGPPRITGHQEDASEACLSEEEEEYEDEDHHSSSSDTLTCSFPEDPDETLSHQELAESVATSTHWLQDSDAMSEAHIGAVTKELDTPESCVDPEDTNSGLISEKIQPTPEKTDRAPADTLSLPAQWKPISKTTISENKPTESVCKDINKETLSVTEKSELVTKATVSLPETSSVTMETGPASVKSVLATKETGEVPVKIGSVTKEIQSVPEIGSVNKMTGSVTKMTGSVTKMTGSVTKMTGSVTKEIGTVANGQLPNTPSDPQEDLDGRWDLLHTRLSEKLNTLRNIQEEDLHAATGSKAEGTGDGFGGLREIEVCAASLRQLRHRASGHSSANSKEGGYPMLDRELYTALCGVEHSLETLTGLLLSPSITTVEDSLRLLQMECLSVELPALSEELNHLRSGINPDQLSEAPETIAQCVTCLQGCFQTAQSALTSSLSRLHTELGHNQAGTEQQESHVRVYDDFERGQSDPFTHIKDVPMLEYVVGRCPKDAVELQRVSQALLQGLASLVELGRERLADSQDHPPHSRTQLQTMLSRHKKLYQVMESQLALVQRLFQCEPQGGLVGQEDEQVRLEQQVTTLQQHALEQGATMHRRLQVWTQWEKGCVQLGRQLEELEALIPCEDLVEEEEGLLQERLDTCQRVLALLEECRPALGSVLDQGKALQAWGCSTGVGGTGGVLELRWRAVRSKAEQESQRSRDIRDNWTRFHNDSVSLTGWMGSAKERLKTWRSLPDATPQNEELTRTYLIQLLEFSVELETRSAEKASALRAGTLLLQLKEADAPGLRRQLAQLEQTWTEVTSALPIAQERLHQHLLEKWPPCQVLSGLEAWVKDKEARLEDQGQATIIACHDADQLRHIIQYYKGCQAGNASGQLTLDFLCQSGPQSVAASDNSVSCSEERTLFAERMGALNLSWLLLEGKLGSQVHQAEEMFRICAEREKRLRRVLSWAAGLRERLREWQRPVSQTQVDKALQEWEAVEEKLKDVCVEVEDLVRDTWSADTVTQVCTDLNQQVGSLRPELQRVLVQWGQFEKELGDVSFYTTKLRCGLEHSSGPFLSSHQVKRHVEQLQCLQKEAGMGAEMWTALDQSYAGLSDAISPGAAQLLIERLEEERTQWKALVQEVDEELLRTGDLLSFWGEYNRLYDQCSVRLQHHQEQWGALLSFLSTPCHSTQDLVDAIKHQQVGFEDVQGSLGEVLEASKPLIGQAEPLVAAIVQSKSMLLSRDLVLLGQALSGKRARLQEDLDQRHTISTSMDSLELQTEALRHMLTSNVCSMDSVKTALMALSHLHPALDDLTEASLSVTLDGLEADRLKSLTRKWAQALYCASHMNRTLQAEAQHSQSLQQKWDTWEGFQEKMEEDLAPDVSGNYSGLREQLAIHQRLRIEVLAGHQLLRGVIVISMRSIEDTPEEKSRPDLTLKLAQMRERWQRIVSVAQQRSSLVQERLGQWRFYTRGVRRLGGLLRDVETLLPSAAQALCTLQQLPCSLEDLGRAEETLAQHNGFYRHTLETGRLLSSMAELQTQAQLQTELQTLQESWDHARELLGERRILLETVVQNWGHFQVRLVDSAHKLDELRDRLKQPLPERLEELQGEEKLTEENEASLELWAGGVKELSTMKTDLSQYILAGDATLLQGQVEQLHCQWEELCLKVSLRRQEIADRLSAWTIFNDKNKELCDWLTQMENKVSHSGDLSLEEMVEKLKKDCMEEINLFSENKSHLKQLGEQLMLASDQAKQAQLHGTLRDARDRWQHLFHHIEARVRKLKETLGMVQQLDKNMSNLRSWLSRIETQLARPVTYNVCHHEEIQRRLAQQQELQRDIEQHTESVASVLRLCDILLHDQDACGGGDGENDSIQQTTCSLDQRWKAICAMSLERRLRIEETWRLWCKFLEDYSCFEDWLKLAERTAANPNSDNVPYTVAKEELKKFEGFQRQVQERVTQLELVNNQYRRLARENRTDGASRIKVMVHEGNCRWDTLHRRTAAILRRLKHFTGQREEFEGTRESLLVWLTEMDLQLTNVEHFSETDTQHKMKQLNSFQREITLNTERIDGLIVFGEGLIQRSSPLDAALIEDELEELHSYCQEVFGRVVRFHQRLTQPPVLKEEPELFSGDKPLVGSCELIGRSWLGRSQSQGSAPATPTHLLAPPLECSGRETPVSVCDSIPLEWDHTGDVGGSSSHEEEEVEKKDGTYYSTLPEVEVTESPEDFVKATAQSLGADPSVPLRSMAIPESPSWRSPGDPDRESLHLDSPDGLDPSPTHTSTPFKQGYVRLMSECSGSIKSVKRVSLILDDEEQPEEQGLTGLTTADKQSGVIERWELLQAQARSNLLSGLREPCQLTSDLRDITSWLEWVTPELERVQVPETPTSIQDMEARVKQLKEMQKVFAHYKAVMLSLNLGSRELVGCDGPEARKLGEGLASMNQGWMLACTGLEEWQDSLRTTVMRCQEFHETLHSLLLWLAHAESRRYAVDIHHPDTPPGTLLEHRNTLTGLQNELRARQSQVGSLQGLWGQLQPAEEEGVGEESVEAREKLHVTANKLWTLLRQVAHDLSIVQERLDCGTLSAGPAAARAAVESEGRGQAEGSQSPSNASQEESTNTTPTSAGRSGEKRDPTPPRSFFYRVLRAAFPLHLLLLLVLVLACLVPLAENDHSCTLSNNFARSFYPMLRYTNGPPPT